MSLPTRGEAYSKLMEHLSKAQEAAAMLSHLHNTESSDAPLARGWLHVSEMFKLIRSQIINFATRARQ